MESMERRLRFKTQIKFPGVDVKLEEVEVNLMEFGREPVLSRDWDNYTWDWSLSISTDRGDEYDEPYDLMTCYINGDLLMKGEKRFVIKINTLHTYHVSKLVYKKEHEELYKSMARESVLHANRLLVKAAKGSAYEGFVLPDLDEDFLEDDATEWNKRGYIPKASKPDENALGRKLTKEEMEALSARAAELVEWIDAYDEKEEALQNTEEETAEYHKKYIEWSKINKQLWHFKLIARNQMAYLSTKIIAAMEKALKANPDDLLLRESYEAAKENYIALMDELKDEFAKN